MGRAESLAAAADIMAIGVAACCRHRETRIPDRDTDQARQLTDEDA